MNKLLNKLYFKGFQAKENAKKILKNESGEANIIAIILILAIVIALAILFRGAIMDLFNRIWDAITNDVDSVI